MILTHSDTPGTCHWLVPAAVAFPFAIIPKKENGKKPKKLLTGTTESSQVRSGGQALSLLIINRFSYSIENWALLKRA